MLGVKLSWKRTMQILHNAYDSIVHLVSESIYTQIFQVVLARIKPKGRKNLELYLKAYNRDFLPNFILKSI
ncbi:hypothetical protein SAMN04489724_1070 [Algoriphagus locisalis]|uniref:Uncharacterized protein n=1 Tax=Algoriphagus locisalis TaxID=305507 RepID=A0A1I6YL23_9BACT|nr:hypothetical protein SAMN04489724_1070 [Algoriphagus locisalis]